MYIYRFISIYLKFLNEYYELFKFLAELECWFRNMDAIESIELLIPYLLLPYLVCD